MVAEVPREKHVNNRPYVVLSCATSLDGYLDDASPTRLVLSNPADLARVRAVRAGVDAILVGANTIRRDNPRLVVPGAVAGPMKVTLTTTGDLDPSAQFFTLGDVPKLVYAPPASIAKVMDRLCGAATVVSATDLPEVLADLHARGVRRLMVEGGGTVLTQFLTSGLADELHLVIAPLLVGDPTAPHFLHPGHYSHPLTLATTQQIDEVVLLRYLSGQSALDWQWLRATIELSRQCPPSTSAFSVGAIIVDGSGVEIARGYSRETDSVSHAEEVALSKVDPADPRLGSATLYSSLEPCSRRASRAVGCSQLIVQAGIPRVVFAMREPGTFVVGEGVEVLGAGGVELVEIEELAGGVAAVNGHLL
ncbi:MAG TPA: dihydrofolate reductase family protein [Actinophytocola sp.]|nr:dihydrofolate reductase family protein [Actinophytocola sp.]